MGVFYQKERERVKEISASICSVKWAAAEASDQKRDPRPVSGLQFGGFLPDLSLGMRLTHWDGIGFEMRRGPCAPTNFNVGPPLGVMAVGWFVAEAKTEVKMHILSNGSGSLEGYISHVPYVPSSMSMIHFFLGETLCTSFAEHTNILKKNHY